MVHPAVKRLTDTLINYKSRHYRAATEVQNCKIDDSDGEGNNRVHIDCDGSNSTMYKHKERLKI